MTFLESFLPVLECSAARKISRLKALKESAIFFALNSFSSSRACSSNATRSLRSFCCAALRLASRMALSASAYRRSASRGSRRSLSSASRVLLGQQGLLPPQLCEPLLQLLAPPGVLPRVVLSLLLALGLPQFLRPPRLEPRDLLRRQRLLQERLVLLAGVAAILTFDRRRAARGPSLRPAPAFPAPLHAQI